MSDPDKRPWSDDPNAPQIPRSLYISEKTKFVGIPASATLYGIVIVLFIRCMRVLLNPVSRAGEGIRWPYVAYTTVMFSFATIYTAMGLDVQSLSFIDNRNVPRIDGSLTSGPIGYQSLIESEAIHVIPDVIFLLNDLLSDGLLLYRCCIFYDTNYWAITLPCLMYLASLAIGIAYIYEDVQPESVIWNYHNILTFGIPYYTISISLSVLLTFMIVFRLIIRSGDNRLSAMGTLTRTIGLYRTIVTIFVESLSLYLVIALPFIGSWSTIDPPTDFFYPILVATQVIATFLIILRVAERRAITRDTISGNVSPIRFRSQGKSSTEYGETLPNRYPMNSVDRRGETPADSGVAAGNAIEQVPR